MTPDLSLPVTPSSLLHHRYQPQGPTPVRLLLHGFMGNTEDWNEVVQNLPVRTLSVDLPAHGKTNSKTDDFSFPAIAAQLNQLLDTLSIETVTVVGYSMGGRLGLYLMAKHPDRYTAGVIVSASPGLASEEDRRLRRHQDAELARKLDAIPYTEFLETWLNQPLFRSLRGHPNFDGLKRRRRHNRPDALSRFLLAAGTGSQPPVWEKLSQLSGLTVVTGEQDDKYGDIADKMKQKNPALRHCIIPGAGHNIPFECPKELAEIIVDADLTSAAGPSESQKNEHRLGGR